jgi:hypothetical protein
MTPTYRSPSLAAAILLLLTAPAGAAPPDPAPQPQPTPSFTGGVPSLSEKLDRNLDAIIDVPDVVIEALDDIVPSPQPDPRPSAARMWIGLRGYSRLYLPDTDRPSLLQIEGSTFRFVNPGNRTAAVGCIFFDYDGNLLIDQGSTHNLGRGASGRCGLHAAVNQSLVG